MRDNSETVSVIVPVYNNVRYLNECIESLLSQTCPNVEIVLVDDGSDAECAALCDSFAGRVKVFHKPNGGISSARNYALERCTGDYICFVDSDDIVAPTFCETLLSLCKEFDAPMAACRLDTFFFQKPDAPAETGIRVLVPQQDKWRNMIEGPYNAMGYACNKLFRKDIIEGLSFDETLVQSEDQVFVFQALSRCEGYAYTDALLYFYRNHPGSESRNMNSAKYKNAIDVSAQLLGIMGPVDADVEALYRDYHAGWVMKYARYLSACRPEDWRTEFDKCREDYGANALPSQHTIIKDLLLNHRAAFTAYAFVYEWLKRTKRKIFQGN